MKKVLVILLLSSLATAQSLTIKSVEQITLEQQGEFFHPLAGPSGALLLSGAAYTGLYYMDVQGQIRQLSDQSGSGYEPSFSTDANYVYFRPHVYQGISKYSSLIRKSITLEDEQVLIDNERNFTPAKKLADGTVAVSRNDQLFIVDDINKSLNKATTGTTVFSEKGKIALYQNGEKKILSPAGDGFYLWPSVSPDGSKILFTKVGQGTYISDLNGNILAELGYANAPRWSPDGQWIVFMRDLDDGHRLIDSDIFITSADGNTTIAVTETNDINEVYPSWGVPSEIVFGSDRGIIYKALLELQ